MKKSIVLFMVITLVSVSLVSAQRHGQFDRKMPGNTQRGNPLLNVPWDRVLEIAEDADLDTNQLQAIENARNILKDTNTKTMAELKELRRQLHDVMIQTDPEYLQSALEISENMAELRAILHQNKIRAEFELKSILTPEQQSQIRETIREHRMERAQNRHERARRGQGERKGQGDRRNRKMDH